MKKIDLYVEDWEERYRVYEVKESQQIPELWCVLLRTTHHLYFVTDVSDTNIAKKYSSITRKTLIAEFKNFEDINYKIYYKQMEQHLVGYLLDFFEYYVEIPDKIITDSEDNIKLYETIRKDKMFK